MSNDAPETTRTERLLEYACRLLELTHRTQIALSECSDVQPTAKDVIEYLRSKSGVRLDD